ncbi:MAG TPA: hypothetical protein VER83_04975 [Candidatus Nanopelagicales bacterium]|nr:hypothetical protein [Candidatus Nanopelagicales bacterium]
MPPTPHSPAAQAEDHAALIVALDAGDLAGAEILVAESLAASCTGCAALVHDLAAIRGAMTALPVPPRRRDYRLTAEDAARLRPSGWRRLLDWLAAPGSTVRPLATGLATLGVVGLLLTSGLPGALSGFGGGAASPLVAPEASPVANAAPGGSGDERLQGSSDPATVPLGAPGYDPGTAATAAPAPVPSGAPTREPAAVAGEAATADPGGERALASGATDGEPESTKAAGREAASTVPFPALVSLALLAAGLALLAGRTIARRPLS